MDDIVEEITKDDIDMDVVRFLLDTYYLEKDENLQPKSKHKGESIKEIIKEDSQIRLELTKGYIEGAEEAKKINKEMFPATRETINRIWDNEEDENWEEYIDD